jgi:poly(A) polymerase
MWMQGAQQAAIEIIRRLRKAGHQAYLVGGCVRDLLLGREPADYDVTTDATPDAVMRIFPETWAVGAQFGVVLVPIPSLTSEPGEATGAENGEAGTDSSNSEVPGVNELVRSAGTKSGAIEVATFRSDIGYSDGRHPDEVRYSRDPREDVERRDFTINGMMLDPLLDDPLRSGTLDYVGGQKDLHAGVVRAIGEPERRFTEDKLRMLRAIRFAARFQYRIEAETFNAIRKLAREIQQVSRERVRDELTKILTEGRAREAFLLLDESGLLEQVLPQISAMKGVEQPPQYHPEGDVFVHTLLLLEQLPHPVSPTLAWGALLHDVGKPPTFRIAPDRIRFDGHVEVGVAMARDICRRLRFSNEDTEQILALVNNHMRFGDALRMKESTLKKFIRLPHFDEHLALHRIDCLSSHKDLSAYEYVREKMASFPEEAVRPAPLITGNDLIAAGYLPGPRFKEILTEVEDAQLESRLNSRDEALQFVKKNYPA